MVKVVSMGKNVRRAVYASSIGDILIEHRGERLLRLNILESEAADRGKADRFSDMVYGQVVEYLRGERRSFDVEIDISDCTPFQRRVLEELQRIGYGERRSYRDVACAIGRPTASRAVGGASRRNPIHLIIPCHRVVGSTGALTGYAGGIAAKRVLLELEGGIV